MAIILDGTDSVGDLGDALAAKANAADVTSALADKADYLAWADYTPATLGAGITVGNGTIVARWAKIGTTVFFRVRFTLGTTSAIAGSFGITLPASVATSHSAGATAVFVDTGASYPVAGQCAYGSSTVTIRALNTASTYLSAVDVSATIPFTWAATDIVDVSGFYEAA